MMATYTEMVVLYPNTLFVKQIPSSGLQVADQSPTSLRSVADWLLTVADYSEQVADRSPTKC